MIITGLGFRVGGSGGLTRRLFMGMTGATVWLIGDKRQAF